MASSPRRDFLKLVFGGALAAVSAALESARTSAEPLGQPNAFAPDTVLDMARELAKSPFKAPASTLPDVFANLSFEQYSAIRRNPGSALWNDEKLGFALEPLHRGFIFATPMLLNVVENGQAQPLIYDRTDYDFGKLHPPANLPDLGFSGVRVLKADAGPGWQDMAIIQGATFFRSFARGQSYGVNARGLSIRTGEEGEEFPIFRALWIEKPRLASDALIIHALLDSASLTGAFHFTLRSGDTTIIDTELTLVARVAVDHLGLGAMTATYFFGPLDHHHSEDVRPSVYDIGGLQILTGAGEWLWRPVASRNALQVSAFAEINPRGFGLLQRARPRHLRRRRCPLGIAPLAMDRADRRLGRGRSDSAGNPLRFRKQRQRHRAMAAENGPPRGRDGLVRLSPVLVLDATAAPRPGDRREFAPRKRRQVLALHR